MVCFFLCVESNIAKGNIAAILQIKTSAYEIVYDGNGALLEAEWIGHSVFSFFGIIFLREGIHPIPFINIVEGVGCSFQGFICFLCLVYVFRLHYHEVAFNACDNRNLVLMFRFKLLSNLTHCYAYGILIVSRGKYLIMAIACFLVDIGGELGIVHIGTDKPVVGTMAVCIRICSVTEYGLNELVFVNLKCFGEVLVGSIGILYDVKNHFLLS